MKHFKKIYLQGKPIENLSKDILERALIQIDSCISLERNHTRVVQYCAVKVDIMNGMMVLDNNEHLMIY